MKRYVITSGQWLVRFHRKYVQCYKSKRSYQNCQNSVNSRQCIYQIVCVWFWPWLEFLFWVENCWNFNFENESLNLEHCSQRHVFIIFFEMTFHLFWEMYVKMKHVIMWQFQTSKVFLKGHITHERNVRITKNLLRYTKRHKEWHSLLEKNSFPFVLFRCINSRAFSYKN